ncbi:hypothetical protein Pelo_11388 [Pelomyxa schiedti]|nr:hypothetical protein Pelo_11388 [Pelomyxa schiedti]
MPSVIHCATLTAALRSEETCFSEPPFLDAKKVSKNSSDGYQPRNKKNSQKMLQITAEKCVPFGHGKGRLHSFQYKASQSWGSYLSSWWSWTRTFPRSFVVYEPPGLTGPAPVLYLFHGTDELVIEESALFMQDELVPEVTYSWQQVADSEGLILVFMQAATWQCSYNKQLLQSWWQPGDEEYVQRVLEFMSNNFSCDKSRLYAIGHSNGGLFMSDLVFKLPATFAAVCNHMGGLFVPSAKFGASEKDIENFRIHFAESTERLPRKTPMLIITANGEDNRLICHTAKAEFERVGWPVEFIEYTNQRHMYLPVHTESAWPFLKPKSLP